MGPGRTYFVGSLADGRIVTGDLYEGGSRVLLAGATGRQIRGLYYDHRSHLVRAAGNVGTVAHVWAVDADRGAVVADVVVPGAVFLNDLVVTRRAVRVTDSRVDRLTRIGLTRCGQPAGTAPEFLPLTGQWPAFDGENINANGIRELADGSLVLNNSTAGGLWQVSKRTGRTREIEVRGGPGLVGGDGLEISGNLLFDVRGSGQNEVSVLRLRAGRRRRGQNRSFRRRWTAYWITALTDETLDVPSTATLAAGALWAVNARFGVTNPDTADYSITRLPLRRRLRACR